MVRIKRIVLEERTVPLEKPFKIALGTITEAENIFVKIVTDQKIEGFGEAAPEAFVTGETLAGCKTALKLLTEELIGENPLNIARIHEIMDRKILGNGAAKAAIDIACYDILGKLSGLPVYQLIGGYQSSVATDITIGIDTPEKMAQEAKSYVSQGFQAIKIKVGVDPLEDVQRVAAIRKAVGPQVKLRVDANQGWTVKEAVKAIQKIKNYDIEFIEQPLKAKAVDGMRFVREHTEEMIMADESVFLPQDAVQVIKGECVDAVNVKLMKCGGIYKALKINAICESAGIPCMVGCMSGETNISIAAAAHFAAAQPNVLFADLDATFVLNKLSYNGIVDTKPVPVIDLSENRPGLGIY